jgi:iron complex transport system permease protein
VSAPSTFGRPGRPTATIESHVAFDRLTREPPFSQGLPISQSSLVIALVAVVIVLAVIASFVIGYIRLTPVELWRAVIGQGEASHNLLLFQFRAPRIVLAMLMGAMLAAAGTILQAITQNDLADPGLLSINAGAGLGIAAMLSTWPDAAVSTPYALPFAALLGGLAAAVVIYVIAAKQGVVTSSRLLLVGIACGFGISAATLILSLRMDPKLYQFTVTWMAGSVAGTSWRSVTVLLPWAIVTLPVVLVAARALDVIALGDQVATGLGMAVELRRRALTCVAVALAASAVAVGGAISFIGLVAPHLARRLVGIPHRVVLPTSMLLGALLVVVADSVGRNVLAPIEIPVGVVTGVIGAPYFLYVLMRRTG